MTHWTRMPIVLTLAALGCSSSSSTPAQTSNDTGSPAEDTAVAEDTNVEDTAVAADTGGPCGVKVGSILCDVDLHGFLHDNDPSALASTVAVSDFKLSEAIAGGTQKYAFVYMTAWW